MKEPNKSSGGTYPQKLTKPVRKGSRYHKPGGELPKYTGNKEIT
jgi:hypothetical protein